MVFRREKILADGTVKHYPHYWYKFTREGRTVRVNTKQPNKRTAEELESAHRTRLARGEADLPTGRCPTLTEFNPTLTSKTGKARTAQFYADRLRVLRAFPPLANARLNHIDANQGGLVEQFKTSRVAAGDAVSSINGCLRTLRKLLGIAYTQKPRLIQEVPKIAMVPDERQRKFVLSREAEPVYLAACPDPLRDIAGLILETGLRLGEALALTWDDIELDGPDPCIHIRQGKTKNAKRDLDLMPPAVALLQRRKATSTVAWPFPNEAETGPALNTTIDHQHKRVRDALHLDVEFVLHSLRHTALTRLVDSGTDSFTLKLIAGHDSVVTSERYIHTPAQAAKAAMTRRYQADAGHLVVTRQKPSRAKSLQIAVNKQAGA